MADQAIILEIRMQIPVVQVQKARSADLRQCDDVLIVGSARFLSCQDLRLIFDILIFDKPDASCPDRLRSPVPKGDRSVQLLKKLPAGHKTSLFRIYPVKEGLSGFRSILSENLVNDAGVENRAHLKVSGIFAFHP